MIKKAASVTGQLEKLDKLPIFDASVKPCIHQNNLYKI